MFTIGAFARHGRLTVRMPRHYDAIGLPRPAVSAVSDEAEDAVTSHATLPAAAAVAYREAGEAGAGDDFAVVDLRADPGNRRPRVPLRRVSARVPVTPAR
jgi:hypothetical protein